MVSSGAAIGRLLDVSVSSPEPSVANFLFRAVAAKPDFVSIPRSFFGYPVTDGETGLYPIRHLYPHVVMLTCSFQTQGVRSWPPGQILGTLLMLHLMSFACLLFLSLVCKLLCVSSISCNLPRCHSPNLTRISL